MCIIGTKGLLGGSQAKRKKKYTNVRTMVPQRRLSYWPVVLNHLGIQVVFLCGLSPCRRRYHLLGALTPNSYIARPKVFVLASLFQPGASQRLSHVSISSSCAARRFVFLLAPPQASHFVTASILKCYQLSPDMLCKSTHGRWRFAFVFVVWTVPNYLCEHGWPPLHV